MTDKLTFNEAFDSLNGDAEDAIEQHYGFDVYAEVAAYASADDTVVALPVKITRALIMGSLIVAGTPVDEALATSRALGSKAALQYFGEEVPEADPEDPDTEVGKDASPASASKKRAPSGA